MVGTDYCLCADQTTNPLPGGTGNCPTCWLYRVPGAGWSVLTKLSSVQRRAQRNHRYTGDLGKHGVPEYWEISLRGDCEDYALWCRQELAKDGIESDLILCLTETGEGHLVCSVDGWILDNRHTKVRRRDTLSYTWLSIGKPNGKWYEILS